MRLRYLPTIISAGEDPTLACTASAAAPPNSRPAYLASYWTPSCSQYPISRCQAEHLPSMQLVSAHMDAGPQTPSQAITKSCPAHHCIQWPMFPLPYEAWMLILNFGSSAIGRYTDSNHLQRRACGQTDGRVDASRMDLQSTSRDKRGALLLPDSWIINCQSSTCSLVRNDEVGSSCNGFAALGCRSWLYASAVCLRRSYGLDDVRKGGRMG